MTQEEFDKLKNAGFDVEGTLKRFMNNEALYLEVLRKYSSDKNCELLESCFLNKNYPDAYIAAHALKGVAKNLGMNSILMYVEPIVSLLKKPVESIEWEAEVNSYIDGLNKVQKDVVALLADLG